MRLLLIVVSTLTLALAAGCGDDSTTRVGADGDRGTTDPASGDADETRYIATAVVLESPGHGPQLCLGAVAESYPPQCGGPDVVGWDWDTVEGEESAAGTTWGTYTVVGTWDGAALTLVAPPSPGESAGAASQDEDRFATPCPEPEGGWQVVDESQTSDESLEAAIAHARSQPAIAGVWVDQSINPFLDEEPVVEERANDPTKLVLNVRFTDDLERHEEEIRRIWGGALCVSKAPFTAAELSEVRAEVEAEVGDFLFSSVDEVNGRVEIGVVIDDGLQQRFDERYGEGVVEVHAQLQPVGRDD